MADGMSSNQGMRARDSDVQVPAYHTEHLLAYVMAIVAVALGVIGLLVGFDVIAGDANTLTAGDSGTSNNFMDGMLWLLPALSAAMLANALHRTDHHLSRNPSTLDTAHKSMWNGEHGLAYVAALGAIGLTVIGMLVGFDVFNNGNVPGDGFLWIVAGLGASILTVTLHSVRHHQLATDEDYILSVVEHHQGQRTSARATGEVLGERNR